MANSTPWALSDVKNRLSLLIYIFRVIYLVGGLVSTKYHKKKNKKNTRNSCRSSLRLQHVLKSGHSKLPHPLLTKKALGLGTSIYDPIFFFPPPPNAYRNVILMFGKGK